jgi:hypothetical protein
MNIKKRTLDIKNARGENLSLNKRAICSNKETEE